MCFMLRVPHPGPPRHKTMVYEKDRVPALHLMHNKGICAIPVALIKGIYFKLANKFNIYRNLFVGLIFIRFTYCT